MDFREYQTAAVRTESKVSPEIQERLKNVARILHGAMGLQTESAELTDALKKHVFYGKPIDEINLAEEVGDLLWYCAILCEALGIEMEVVAKANVHKLKLRYGEKFSEEGALFRNLEAEGKGLEGDLS